MNSRGEGVNRSGEGGEEGRAVRAAGAQVFGLYPEGDGKPQS